MPRIRVRWKIKKKITDGIKPISAAAARAVGSLVNWPVVIAIARVTVWLLFDGNITSGIMN